MDEKLSITDLKAVTLNLEFIGDMSCSVPLSPKQTAAIIYVLGLNVENDEVVGYTDEKLDELYAGEA